MSEKRDAFLPAFLLTFAVTACITFGALFGLATAYSLPIVSGELTKVLVLCAGMFSAYFSLRHRFSENVRFAASILSASGLVIVLFFCREEIVGSLRTVLDILIPSAEQAFRDLHLPHPTFAEGTEEDATAFLELLGLLLSWAASRCLEEYPADLCLEELFVVFAPVAGVQMLLLDRSPETWCAALMVCGLLGLLFCRMPKKSGTAGVMFAMLIPAALLASAALFFIPETYTVPAWRDRTLQKIAEIWSSPAENGKNAPSAESETLGISFWNRDVSRIPLEEAGPEEKNGAHVMDVFSDEDTRCYLFGTAYGIYDGTSWAPVKEFSYSLLRLSENHWLTGGYGENTVWIRTERRSSILYLPYGFLSTPSGAEIRLDSCIRNGGGLMDYLLPVGSGNTGFGTSASYRSFVQSNYTDVPDETEKALAEIVAELKKKTASMTPEEKAEAAAEYVRSSAAYDLNTPRLPSGRDFVSWFLLESDTGYCVHFASAAVILMRSLGLPARFVTGYAVYLPGGEWVEVTEDQAHAWAEYYREGVGWVKVEATGSYELVPPPPREKPEVEVVFVPEEELERPEETESREEEVEEDLPEEEEEAPSPAAQTGGGRRSVDPLPLLAIGLPALLLLWQAAVRLIRYLRLNSGTPEERACRIFRYAEKLAALAGKGTAIPDSMRIPAERARFGRPDGNAVTEEELERMRKTARLMRKRLLKQKSVPGRLWLILRYAL